MSSLPTPLEISISDMHCVSCAGSVQRALEGVSGVEAAQVDFAQGRATITPSGEGPPDLDVLLAAISRAGFTGAIPEEVITPVVLRSELEQRQHASARFWRWRFILGLSIWVPLETLHWTLGGSAAPAWLPWVMCLSSTVAVVLVGSGFFQSAFQAARRGQTNMDTLVSIGVLTAWSYSMVLFVLILIGEAAPQMTYFAEAAALLGIISLGHWLEARASAQAGSAVRGLLELQPETAERLQDDGNTSVISIANVRQGERLLVRPGTRVAVDGRVLEGTSELDESVVTGEPIPVRRAVGDVVVAGSMNTTGRLIVESTVDGTETTVARIAALVTTAMASKADIQRLADRVSSIFVPLVLGIALLTIVVWSIVAIIVNDVGIFQDGLVAAVAVLVVSCPCALGLATPMAVMVGTSEAARSGILVKSAAAMERAGLVECVIFDKTGTLTTGRPAVEDISAEHGEVDRVLDLAAAVETPSEHPIARAIVSAAEETGRPRLKVRDFLAAPGRGVSGTVGDHSVQVIRDQQASCQVLVDERPIGTITVADTVRTHAATAISMLHAAKIRVEMLTGDRRAPATQLARSVGIDERDVHADQTPESKQRWVSEHRERTMMVGDGINDAAALAEADLGVALGTGTNIAIEAADIIIPGDRLESVPETIQIARMTRRAIRQNLFFAFMYNTTLIPVAAIGLLGAYGPIWAAIAMGLSDTTVVGNAVRLGVRLRRRRQSTTPARD